MGRVRLTWAAVRARQMVRHGLAAPFASGTPEAVAAALAGVHAQVMSAAEVAIGIRLDGATRRDVRGAAGLVRTFGPRGTVHLLPIRHLGLWIAALEPVAAMPKNFKPDVQLTRRQTDDVVAAIRDSVAADGPLTIGELDAAVVSRTGPWAGDLVMPAFQGFWPRWRQALNVAGLRGLMCFGPDRGRKVTYTSPGSFRPASTAEAGQWLVRAYLTAYGPSTSERFANWLGVPAAAGSTIFAAADLTEVDIEGTRAFVAADDVDMPSGEAAEAAEAARGVRLLPYFDSYSYRVGLLRPELLYPGPAAARFGRGSYQNLSLTASSPVSGSSAVPAGGSPSRSTRPSRSAERNERKSSGRRAGSPPSVKERRR